MGKYLDQCADDAWEVISGKKKRLLEIKSLILR